MLKRNYTREIQDQFDKIRGIIGDYFVYVCDAVSKDLQTRADNISFVSEVRESKNETARNSVKQKVANKRTRSTAQVQLAFSDIRKIIGDWMSEEMPANLSAIIRTAHDTGIHLTLPELQVLCKQTTGNYFAQKFIAQMASDDYYQDFRFTDYDTIARTLKGAEGDVIKVIQSFAGAQNEKGRFMGDWLTDADPFFQMWASDFTESENTQLRTAEKMLEQVTNTENILLDDDFAKIAHVFADQGESDKIKTMADLILSNTIDESKLMAFNADLFVKAKTAIAEDAETKAKKARETLHKALEDNHLAQVNSAKMAGEKARAESKASKMNNNVIHR